MKENLLKLPLIRRIVAVRGTVSQDSSRCLYCGKCAKACPMGAITVSREARTLQVAGERCVRCGKCVKTCPKGALRIEKKKDGQSGGVNT